MEALAATEETTRQYAVVAPGTWPAWPSTPTSKRGAGRPTRPRRGGALQDVLVAVSRRSDHPAQCAQQLMAAWKSTQGDARMNVLEIICLVPAGPRRCPR